MQVKNKKHKPFLKKRIKSESPPTTPFSLCILLKYLLSFYSFIMYKE